jgi:hypothetical protein
MHILKATESHKKKEGLVNYDIIKKGRFWLFALECELPYLEFSKAKEHQHL